MKDYIGDVFFILRLLVLKNSVNLFCFQHFLCLHLLSISSNLSLLLVGRAGYQNRPRVHNSASLYAAVGAKDQWVLSGCGPVMIRAMV